jgi:ATP adenylyltransferase
MADRPLWAPWRIEYITGPRDGSCIFCEAVAPEAAKERPPSELPLERGRYCFTLLNAYPYAPGHVMVAPSRHVGELDQLDDDELLELMQLARRSVRALREVMTPDGFNTGLNLGTVAGAGIAAHLHLHVVPRWNGDTNFMPVLADTPVIPQALDVTHELLAAALARLSA